MSTSNPYAAKGKVSVRQAERERVVPAGTISEVLGWVGDDPERANLALKEETKGHQRKTLLEKLNTLING